MLKILFIELFLLFEINVLSLSGNASNDGVTNNVATVANDRPNTIAHARGCTKYVSGLLYEIVLSKTSTLICKADGSRPKIQIRANVILQKIDNTPNDLKRPNKTDRKSTTKTIS